MARGASFVIVVAALLCPALPASAGGSCGFEHTRIDTVDGIHTYVETETRDCPEGRSFMLAIADPAGRTSLEWYDDDRGQGLEVFRPPYFASWTNSERGCEMVVYVFALGAVPFECVAGAPPTPIVP